MRKKKGEFMQKDMAKRMGLSTETISRYKRQGVDITSEDAIRAHQLTKRDRGIARVKTTGDLHAEKLRLIKAQADKAELEVRRIKRELVPVEEVRTDLLRIGSVVKALIVRLESDLPPVLHGLEPADMQLRLRESCDGILMQLSEMSAYIGDT